MELFESVVMVPKREDGEKVSTIRCVVNTIGEKKIETVETIRPKLQQLLVVGVKLQQVV